MLPSKRAVGWLATAGVTHVMVHPSRFYQDPASVMAKVNASPYLLRMAVGRGGDVLYRLR